MPIERITLPEGASDYPEALSSYEGKAPTYRVLLYPHRSLPPVGFVTFIAITSAMLALPLLALINTPVFWGMLPFMVITVVAIWMFLKHSYRTGQLVEELSLWPDRIALTRRNPNGELLHWEANPYWVEIMTHDTPVPHYLTLRGGPREVELGAFLPVDEREELHVELEDELRFLAVGKPN